MKLTENMIVVLKALAKREGREGYAVEVLEDETLKGKTFNAVNATLAAAAGKNLVRKEKGLFNDKLLTKYIMTEEGIKVIGNAE